MSKFITKPIVVEAIQLVHNNDAECKKFCRKIIEQNYHSDDDKESGLYFDAIGSDMYLISYGDWIVRYPDDTFNVISDSFFRENFLPHAS